MIYRSTSRTPLNIKIDHYAKIIDSPNRQWKQNYNLGQNICRLFHLFALFLYTTNETILLSPESDCTKFIYKFIYTVWNLKKISEMLEVDGKYPAGHPKRKFWQLY